jgi:methylmalonyl-CoA mutase C-terminal domain/subunit
MRTEQRRIRVLLCKPSLDMHSRGILVVARALRDAGMEVIYLEASPHIGAREIIKTALEEGVDIIGLSILSGSPKIIVSRILAMRDQMGISDVPVIVGGIIPDEEVEELRKIGAAGIFLPGTYMETIVKEIYRLTGDK